MGVYVFNDLSLQKNYTTISALKKDLKELVDFYDAGKKFEHTIYVHRDAIKQVSVLKTSFYKTLKDKRFFTDSQRVQIFTMLDKSTPVLPDDTAIPSSLAFCYEGQVIPNTGLAECAYQAYMNEAISTYSLSASRFLKHILIVSIKQNNVSFGDISIENYFSLSDFNQKLQSLRGPMKSWDDFFDFAESRYKWVECTNEAKMSLKRQEFEQLLVEKIISRTDALEQMAEAQSEEIFLELENKYCHGDRAWFTDESDTRKRDLENRLTFTLNGVQTLCSYHGKISYRTFRIHFAPRPKRGAKIYIAYIGRKIT
jgi:predicted HTH domain antitoxin